MNLNKIFFLVLIFFSSYSFGSSVSYSTIESFHESRLKSIVEEYNLEGRAKITFTLLSLAKKTEAEDQILKLPGLLLDVISLSSQRNETGLPEIVDALKDYKRKVTILKTAEVSDKEIQVVRQALKEELYLSSSSAFTVKAWNVPTIPWSQSFRMAFYDKVLLSPWALVGLLAFCVVIFLILGLSSSILNGFKHIGKSIYESVDKTLASGGGFGSPSMEGFNDGLLSGGRDETGSADDDLETFEEVTSIDNYQEFDPGAVFNLMIKANEVKPYEFSFKMWEAFPRVEDQLSLYVFFQSELDEVAFVSFGSFFGRIFKMEAASDNLNFNAKAMNLPKSIWDLRLALTHMMVRPVSSVREEIFGILLTDYEGQVEKIIDGSITEHFNVISYVLRDRVLKQLKFKTDLDEQFSLKILDYMTKEKGEKEPTSFQVKSFEKHLRENSNFKSTALIATGSEEIEILKRLPDHILFGGDSLDENKKSLLKTMIPNFSWIDYSDSKVSKQFILSLSPDEATHFIRNYDEYDAFKSQLETRLLSRLQELEIKSRNSNSVSAILGLRARIARFYKPQESSVGQEEILSAA